MKRNTDKCNNAVYSHGEHVGIYAWGKQEAEAFSQRMTDRKWLYDWYFSGGRIVMLRLRRGPIAALGRLLSSTVKALTR